MDKDKNPSSSAGRSNPECPERGRGVIRRRESVRALTPAEVGARLEEARTCPVPVETVLANCPTKLFLSDAGAPSPAKQANSIDPGQDVLAELTGEPVSTSTNARMREPMRALNMGGLAKAALSNVNVSRVLLLMSLPLILLALVVLAGFTHAGDESLLLTVLIQAALVFYIVTLPIALGFNRWATARDMTLAILLLAAAARLPLHEVESAPRAPVDEPTPAGS